jgi:hypothetical protein
MKAHTSHILRFTGLVIGALLAVSLVLSGRMPASQAEAPARLSMASQPTTQLGVEPAGKDFIADEPLLPGGRSARGLLSITNFTNRRLGVRLRTSSAQRDLDRLVRLRVSSGGRTVFEGGLGQLRSWSRGIVRLAAADRRKVRFRAWLPMSVESGYEGRSVELELEWKRVTSR